MPRRGRLRRAFNRATGRAREGVGRAGEAISNFFARQRERARRR